MYVYKCVFSNNNHIHVGITHHHINTRSAIISAICTATGQSAPNYTSLHCYECENCNSQLIGCRCHDSNVVAMRD